MTAENARIVRELTRNGMSATGVIIAMRMYHDTELTRHQVAYYLHKAGLRRPKVHRSKVLT